MSDAQIGPARSLLLVGSLMVNRFVFVALAACSQPRSRPAPVPHPPPPPPVGAYVEYEVHANGNDELGVHVPQKDQPPHVKLRLGHYRNAHVGIGLTIDRFSAATEDVADIDPAKLRFDGDTKIWFLEGQHGAFGRIDYMRDPRRIMLQIYRDGRVSVFVPDPDTDRSSDAIDVYRDGDADPL